MSEEIRGLFRFGELEIGDKFKFERSNPNRCAGILFEKNELQHNSLREGDEWNIHCVKYPEMEEFHLYLENDTVVEVDWDTAVRINARKAKLMKTDAEPVTFNTLKIGDWFIPARGKNHYLKISTEVHGFYNKNPKTFNAISITGKRFWSRPEQLVTSIPKPQFI